MIIHTVSFRIELGFDDNLALMRKVKESKTMFKAKYKNGRFIQYSASYGNIRLNFNPSKYKHHLIIECEVNKIIGESYVVEKDLDKFEKKFTKIVQEFFLINFPIFISEYPLFRIDYKYDVRFQNDQELHIFYEIISKVKDRCYNLNRIKPDDEDKTSLYYRPKGKIDEKGKNHYKRGRMNLNGYHRYNYTNKEEDKNVVRLEVQVFSKKINLEFKKYRITKELVNYWNENSYNEYMEVYEDILYTQDYYRIDIALQKIKEVEKMRPSTKKRICKLLVLINEFGETMARKKFSKEYSQSAFYRDMKKLKELGINPITFGNMQEKNFNDIECLKNFLKKKENISMD